MLFNAAIWILSDFSCLPELRAHRPSFRAAHTSTDQSLGPLRVALHGPCPYRALGSARKVMAKAALCEGLLWVDCVEKVGVSLRLNSRTIATGEPTHHSEWFFGRSLTFAALLNLQKTLSKCGRRSMSAAGALTPLLSKFARMSWR